MEFALAADGASSPAEDALRQIMTGTWEADPEAVAEGIPSDAQIQSRAKVMSGIKYFARHGYPPRASGVNALRDGIWEFKERYKRISFFDTDGRGGYEPKHKFTEREESDYPDSEYWHIPSFDECIRLGHCFGKPPEQRTTTEQDIEATLRVRREDLSHDQ
ncbi:hypothetical protein [Rathayibacter festucae]|uniref:hypothetical protein n=1 Tax=Rathayibacter festucae TaxID=110937 RepID=UPI002A6AD526|nr:hypothetical protein [Rathayibacter festucae]MDY0911579.1 hypothetical protein [Rathayibacter festucae]